MTRMKHIMGWVAVALTLSFLSLNSAAWAADYQSTCRYFSNQAFQDRHGGVATTFRMELAQDCVDARFYARSEDFQVRTRARAYLALLENYRRVIATLMLERMRDPASRHASGDARRYVRPAFAAVSWPGAYLIARDMGLIETHRDWTDFRRSLTAADARLRLD
ncbi:MAG: hypothetical protein AAFW64_07950 [Pseudomonadota bacterium]